MQTKEGKDNNRGKNTDGMKGNDGADDTKGKGNDGGNNIKGKKGNDGCNNNKCKQKGNNGADDIKGKCMSNNAADNINDVAERAEEDRARKMQNKAFLAYISTRRKSLLHEAGEGTLRYRHPLRHRGQGHEYRVEHDGAGAGVAKHGADARAGSAPCAVPWDPSITDGRKIGS